MKIKKQDRINLGMLGMFFIFSLFVGLSYGSSLIKNNAFLVIRNIVILGWTCAIYAIGGYYFYKATMVFK